MLDIVIIGLFFVSSLIIGLLSSRKINNFSKFSVGDRNFSTFAIFATLSASFIGGGYIFGNASRVHELGIWYVIALLGCSIREILVSIWITPSIYIYRDCYTVGDIIEKNYGTLAKIITGCFSVFLCMGILGAQISALNVIFSAFFDLNNSWLVVPIFMIVVAYSTFGGMPAVVSTDVFQFLILAIGIPLTFFIGLHHIGGFNQLVSKIPDSHIYLTTDNMLMLSALFFAFMFGEALAPPYMQRLFMTKNEKNTRNAIMISGLFSIPFFLIAGSIGLISCILHADLPSNESLPYVVRYVLPNGIKGFVIASLFAVIISSASSFLNTAAISLINDVLRPLMKQAIIDKTCLFLVKAGTFIIGCGAIISSLVVQNVLDILLYAYNFWSPVILVSLLFALKSKKNYKLDFFTVAIGGIIGVIIAQVLFQSFGHHVSIVCGLICSLLMMMLGRLFVRLFFNHLQAF